MLRYLFGSAVTWTVVGLVGGLAYREVTKALDHAGPTQLALVHAHALVLGTLLTLLLLALAAGLPDLVSRNGLRWGTHLLNAGLALTVAMLGYKGTLQVLGAPWTEHAALAGVSGLGHLLLAAAFGVLLAAVGRAVAVAGETGATAAG